MTDNQQIQSVLTFWFEDSSTPAQWYKKDSLFDTMITTGLSLGSPRFEWSIDDWAAQKDGCLALIILLDQFTRNMFRDTPRSFAGDDIALALSLKAHKAG